MWVALAAAAVVIFIESADMVSIWMDVVSIYLIPSRRALGGSDVFLGMSPKALPRDQWYSLDRSKKPLENGFEPATRYFFVGITILVYIFLGILLRRHWVIW